MVSVYRYFKYLNMDVISVVLWIEKKLCRFFLFAAEAVGVSTSPAGLSLHINRVGFLFFSESSLPSFLNSDCSQVNAALSSPPPKQTYVTLCCCAIQSSR